MIRLNLPSFDIKVSGSKQHPQILDVLRRKFITLTPEEWVRQHFVHFLIEHKGYPASLLANEIQLKCGDKVLRADSVLYSRELQPRMIIEYKAPHIPITQKVFDQISVYNLLLHVDFLVVSNGLEHYICKMDYESKKICIFRDHSRLFRFIDIMSAAGDSPEVFKQSFPSLQNLRISAQPAIRFRIREFWRPFFCLLFLSPF